MIEDIIYADSTDFVLEVPQTTVGTIAAISFDGGSDKTQVANIINTVEQISITSF
jgi:hypothetical protein